MKRTMSLFVLGVIGFLLVAKVALQNSSSEVLLRSGIKQEQQVVDDQVLEKVDVSADPNFLDEDGWPPLMYAVQGVDDEATREVQALVDAGAQVNATTPYGMTVLMRSVYKGTEGMVRYLLAAGANAHVRDQEDETVLMKAMYNPEPDIVPIVKMLLNAGVEVNAVDKKGRTALMSVVSWPCSFSKEVVAELVAAGADIHIVNAKELKTVLDYVCSEEIKNYLKTLGSKTYAEL